MEIACRERTEDKNLQVVNDRKSYYNKGAALKKEGGESHNTKDKIGYDERTWRGIMVFINKRNRIDIE